MSQAPHTSPRSIIAAVLLAACSSSCGRKEPAPQPSSPDLSQASLPARSQSEKTAIPLASAEEINLAQESFIRSRPQEGNDALYAGEPIHIAGTRSPKRTLKVLNNTGYVTGYDESRHTPAWVAYRLNRQAEVGENTVAAPRDLFNFKTDTRTASLITDRFYHRSGYDRGHLAPNDAIGVNYGVEAQRETFLMSNVAPQRPQFNRGIWAQIERIEQNRWANEREAVWIITGPVYSDSEQSLIRHKSRAIPVPSAFFKIFVDEEGKHIHMFGMIVPHDTKPGTTLLQFLSSVDDVERISGFDFNPALPDSFEEHLEAKKP